jgi:queuine tRNA-ribosyltransferase
MDTHFELLGTDPRSGARRGRLRTRHGVVETPVFMPVGTQATVKALTPAQIRETGAEIVLSNTYHLALRPGSALVREFGGLHRFMGWDGPILTDSGGFQVYSLAKLRRVTDEGISFQSHLDGSRVFLGPREVVRLQQDFGSDIAMVIDECPAFGAPRGECARAVRRSGIWAAECLRIARDEGFLAAGHHLFAIVQGSVHDDLRREAAEQATALGFPGYAIGGVAVGEEEPEMLRQVAATTPHLPAGRPRYTMGLGTPPQILAMIGSGVDMFDCVLPTRMARNGAAFTPGGVINLRNERWRTVREPLVPGCACHACRTFAAGYVRHLVMAGEILACTLLTLHNVSFYVDLVRRAREHILAGDFAAWSRAWIERYEAGGRDSP